MMNVSSVGCGITIVPRLDLGHISRIEGSHGGQTRIRSGQPKKRTCMKCLIAPVDLQCVVSQRRAEVVAPMALVVIAVRARVGQDLLPAFTQLDRQRVGMSMRGGGQKPMGPVIQAAPQLVRAWLEIAQDRNPGGGKAAWTLSRSNRPRDRTRLHDPG